MGSENSPCAACKHQRRKCSRDCVFAPHFPPHHLANYKYVHQVYGASNVGKLLSKVDPSVRQFVAESLVHDAKWRVAYPVYGSTIVISQLHQQIAELNRQLQSAKREIFSCMGPQGYEYVMNNQANRCMNSSPNPSTTPLPLLQMQQRTPIPLQQMQQRTPQQELTPRDAVAFSNSSLTLHCQGPNVAGPSSSTQNPCDLPQAQPKMQQQYASAGNIDTLRGDELLQFEAPMNFMGNAPPFYR